MLSWSWCPTCLNYWGGGPSMRLPGRSRMLRFTVVSLLCGLLVAQTQPPPKSSPQQADPPEAGHKIVVSVENVMAPVLVFDRGGGFVSGLRPDQFRLFDNNKEQNIHVDETYIPISLV